MNAGQGGCIDVLDLGCGCGVFGIYTLYSLAVKVYENRHRFSGVLPIHINLSFSDIDRESLNNLPANISSLRILLSTSPLNSVIRVCKYQIIHSSMFNSLPESRFDLIVANLPQSPFQTEGARVDKNAGRDSLRWHSIFLKEHARFIKTDSCYAFSLLLYSHMAQPARYLSLCE